MMIKWIKEQFKDAEHANFSIAIIGGVGCALTFIIGMTGYLLSK